jgi:DNA (cytosine-5)-methyltransferase 1
MIYHMDLFSGIGGFALALRWVSETTGIPSKTIGFCDIEEFPCKILNKHWPEVPICKDVNNVEEIKTIVASHPELLRYLHGQPEEQPTERRQQAQCIVTAGIRASLLLTGGFPCQGFSRAGKRRGSNDDRYLWPQTFAIVKAIKPDYCLFENVTGILDMVFPNSAVGMASQASLFEADSGGAGSMGNGRRIRQYDTIIGSIMADLESEGYSARIVVLPAVSVGAPHRRDRIWIIAHANGAGSRQVGKDITNGNGRKKSDDIRQVHSNTGASSNSNEEGLQIQQYEGCLRQQGTSAVGTNRNSGAPDWSKNWYEVATRFCRVDDGISGELDAVRKQRIPRLKALGNAICVPVAYEILKAVVLSDCNNQPNEE